MIHAGVGANKTMMCLGNQNATAAKNAARLLQNNFDRSRVSFQVRRELLRFPRRFDRAQRHHAALRLGNNFLRDGENVAAFESQPLRSRSSRNPLGENLALSNLGKSGNGEQAQSWWNGTRLTSGT